MGISSSHVHDLISNIAEIGFTHDETRAICVEIPQDHPHSTLKKPILIISSPPKEPLLNEPCLALLFNGRHTSLIKRTPKGTLI